MKIKDCSGREHDIFAVCVEADRDERMEAYFYVMGKISGMCGRVDVCCIKAFRGVEGMDAALCLQEELRAALAAEREAIYEKAREVSP